VGRALGSVLVFAASCSYPNFEFSEQDAGLVVIAPPPCAEGGCVTASCDDHTQSGTETDVDCGGGGCKPCAAGQKCNVAADCESAVCADGTCSQPTCSDKVKNGDESDVDCGGGCPTCAPGQRCNLGTDCAGGSCTGSTCALVCLDGRGNCDGDATNGCETNLKTDAQHCGSCDGHCNVPHASALCSGGKCQVQACTPPFADCDGDPSNGCETNTSSDAKNCGACGTTCVDINGTPACADSKCQITCAAGYADCDDDRSNGCEKRTDNDVNNCGMCGKVCNAGNGTPWCNAGKCGVNSCPAGFGDCNGDPSDGCEVNLTSDPNNCKTCGSLCVVANGAAKCSASTCQIASCDANHADCSGGYADGCETNITSDVGNCGGCGTSCAVVNATPQCQNKVCKVKTCTPPWADCAGTGTGCLTNTSTSAGNCGGCGTSGVDCNAVYGPLNASGKCVSGGCQLAKCATNFADCNMNPDIDGCESNLLTSNTHCGTCDIACQAPHGTNTCTMGVCTPSCGTSSFQSCGNPNSGCDTDTRSSKQSCGACGTQCMDNQTSSNECVSSVCAPMCLPNYKDCDTSRANGCETPTSSDPNNCGNCNVQCGTQNASGTSCGGGACKPVCNSGWGACSNPVLGCTNNLTNDSSNCGMCGMPCPSGQQCMASKCVASGFSVLYGVQNSNATSPYIECELHAKNSGTSMVTLSELKVRYYFTDEVKKAPQITINWSHISTSGANQSLSVGATPGTVVPAATGADSYIEFGLSSSHSMLGPGESADFSWRMNGPNQATDIYTQTNDYSFDASKTSVTVWDHVVLMQNGSILWGTVP
jgi:hypothetical protein